MEDSNDKSKSLLKPPPRSKITGRAHTLRTTCIKAIIPTLQPPESEKQEALKILRQDPANLECVYCGTKADEWDHFRAVVKDKAPSGYVSDVYNLVPCCSICNSSKRGHVWKDWMLDEKIRNSPASRGVKGLMARVNTLHLFELWGVGKVSRIPAAFLESESIKSYLDLCDSLIEKLQEYQKEADKIRIAVESVIRSTSSIN
jgi:hypothetical protein